jgi:hypothetical protein
MSKLTLPRLENLLLTACDDLHTKDMGYRFAARQMHCLSIGNV